MGESKSYREMGATLRTAERALQPPVVGTRGSRERVAGGAGRAQRGPAAIAICDARNEPFPCCAVWLHLPLGPWVREGAGAQQQTLSHVGLQGLSRGETGGLAASADCSRS